MGKKVTSTLPKLFFKYISINSPVVFMENKTFGIHNLAIMTTKKNFLYIVLHLTLTSTLKYIQLVDMFAYEIAQNNTDIKKSNVIIVYNFSSLQEERKYYILIEQTTEVLSKNFNNYWNNTIENYYSAANWLEREISEFYNIIFQNKKDIRNLMLQYGDSSSPMLKSFPTVGIKEYYFNVLNQTITQNYLELTN
uniref:NADH dehydrogenase subunit 9 n=1 Tax=Strombidium sp. TaxID=181122 RepID=A0A7T0M4X8_9SPIT|nr:NADH dehydrogenase subunit 9 [Strombidium sp.]